MIYAFVPPPKSAVLEDNCATLNCFSSSLFLLTYIFSVVPLAIFPVVFSFHLNQQYMSDHLIKDNPLFVSMI